MNRELQRLARRNADQQTERIAELPTGDFFATVTAWDGTVLTLSRRGSTFPAAGRAASYTPGVGDWVACRSIDNQPIAICRVV